MQFFRTNNVTINFTIVCFKDTVLKTKQLRDLLVKILKSDNLQYNTLARWVDGKNDSSTKLLMFQALFFFIISYRLRALKTFYFYYKKVKKLIETIFEKNFARNYEKKKYLEHQMLGR